MAQTPDEKTYVGIPFIEHFVEKQASICIAQPYNCMI